jgi:hypothetical protein
MAGRFSKIPNCRNSQFVAVCCILLSLFSTSLFAAPVGNPASPSILQKGLFISDTRWCQPRASFAQDFTSQQLLTGSESKNFVQKASLKGRSQLGTATWSIQERFDLSMTLGTSSNQFRFFELDQIREFQASSGLVWFGSAKLALIELKETSFSLFGQAGGWDWMKGPYSIQKRPVIGEAALHLRFWQVGAAFSQRIGHFSPYMGIVVFESVWKVTMKNEEIYRFSQTYDTGPIVGCTLSSASAFSLNVEWRGWFENAFNVSGEIRF